MRVVTFLLACFFLGCSPSPSSNKSEDPLSAPSDTAAVSDTITSPPAPAPSGTAAVSETITPPPAPAPSDTAAVSNTITPPAAIETLAPQQQYTSPETPKNQLSHTIQTQHLQKPINNSPSEISPQSPSQNLQTSPQTSPQTPPPALPLPKPNPPHSNSTPAPPQVPPLKPKAPPKAQPPSNPAPPIQDSPREPQSFGLRKTIGFSSSLKQPFSPTAPYTPDPETFPDQAFFTIFHSADDDEEVFISYNLQTFKMEPGECLMLEEHDFSTLGVQIGLGGLGGLVLDTYIECGLEDIPDCQPSNYVILDRAFLFTDNYVMESGPNVMQDTACTPITDRVSSITQ